MMKVLKVTMQSQVLVNITAHQSQSINPFDMFEASSDEEESGDENADDPMDAEDQMDEPVDEELTNNTDVSPYTNLRSRSSSSPPNHTVIDSGANDVIVKTSNVRPPLTSHTVLAKCKKLSSSTIPPNYTVVDSGATVHMDNNESLFEYITPVTDDDDNPLYVQ